VRFPRATIDSSALRHNLAVVRRLAPSSRVMAIIKANAYGHGLVGTAKALATADAFGVARLEEGLMLREAGIQAPTVLLEGVFNQDELSAAARERFEIVVHTFEQIELLESSPAAKAFQIWVKVDTGMNRLGFRPDDLPAAWQRLKRLAPLQLRLMTHLAAAEARDKTMTLEQIDQFEALSAQEGVERSIANSAGLILWDDARVDWVRPGLILYGISPIPNVLARDLDLRPVMTLATQLISVRRVPAGETVGYNGIWSAPRESIVGIAAVGYGDGYPRNMRTGAPVLVNDIETEIVGRVSMDMIAIDLTDIPAAVGDRVVLWGEGLPAERIAPYADTIAYELVCGISQRVAVEWK
jgi:alanine racemase